MAQWRLECDAETAEEARHQVPQPAGVGRTQDPSCVPPTHDNSARPTVAGGSANVSSLLSFAT
jgi:hypothetical protein